MCATKAFKPPDWQQVIDSLYLATDRDLVRLRVGIDAILLDPQRIASIRRRLAVGQLIHYMSERENRFNSGRVAELLADRVLIQTQEQKLRWLHYGSIQLDPPVGRGAAPVAIGRAAFAVGDPVSFEDRELAHCFGVIKRINAKSATVARQTGADVRVPYAQLLRVVDL